MEVVHEQSSTLSLAGISLHIEGLAPLPSADSIEGNKAQSLVGAPRHLHPDAVHHHSETAWLQTQVADRLGWMAGFTGTKKGELIYQNEDVLKKQQGVVKEVMLQVGSQLLTGKLGVRISLPIRIFEPRTLLERVADGWNYAPTLLKKAALSSSDPVERLKFLMAFVAGGFHFCVGQLKPFNPIIGETYQATYPDGAQIAMEHVR